MAHFHHTHTAMSSNTASAAFDGGMLREPVLWKCLLLIGIAYLVWSEKLSIVLDLSPGISQEQWETGGQKVRASLLPDFFSSRNTPALKKRRQAVSVELPAGSTGSFTYVIDPGFARRNDIDAAEAAAAIAKCKDYVARFAPVAVAEMHKFGIPASIILAQGILESDAGDSKLARSTNNHFGIKCFSNHCKKGHCLNFSDDSHKDFFIKYGNSWGSYRAHSQLLKNSRRFGNLFELDSKDFQGWARGLAQAGYATDRKYGEKLIALINNLQLDAFDQR